MTSIVRMTYFSIAQFVSKLETTSGKRKRERECVCVCV